MLDFFQRENESMKFVRFLGFLWILIPTVSFAAPSSEFQSASQLLSAARRGDTQTVQILINRGVNVNYVDSTGLSLVCTAVMNNDTRAIQVLQMYGADASKCDRQIKNYKQKSKVAKAGEEYGFFSGLSSSHIIALSALGVAAVIGGVVWLTDAFDSENNNAHSSSGGSHSGSGGGSSGGETTVTTKLFAQNLPKGPAPTCSGETCQSDFAFWEGLSNFNYMSDMTNPDTPNTFNYLMASRAYNAFVRGYLGLRTIRVASDKSPFDLSNFGYYPDGEIPGGGKPVNVAMITGSGVNQEGTATDSTIAWIDSSQITSVQKACASDPTSSDCQTATNKATFTSHKYYNLSGEEPSENPAFDLTGGGTVFGSATGSDTKLAKIIAGSGSATDFYGFIPNGQLTVYKIGNNHNWTEVPAGTEVTGEYHIAGTSLAVNDTFELFGETLKVVSVSNGNFIAVSQSTSNSKTYHGYIQGDNLYIDSNTSGYVNQMYTMGAEDSLTLTNIMLDYQNYSAIYNALQLKDSSGDYVTTVVANLNLPTLSSKLEYPTVGVAKVLNDAGTTSVIRKNTFLGLINNYYNLDTTNDTTSYATTNPGIDAGNAFSLLGQNQQHILVNPAGHSLYGLGESQMLVAQDATFENFAPVVYNDPQYSLQNLFATVVAVRPAKGTAGSTIEGYSASASGAGKLGLSTWNDENDSSITYSSRMCGLTGTGNGGAMNPWCFSAPGATDLEATAAMAGSIALVKSAFDYMTPKQIFLLLALTADGPYLGTNPSTNKAWESTDDLMTYLQNMYSLPANLDSSSSQYLESFKQAFGYGMINLERATRPGTNVYFYSSDTNSIVASNGKSAYWRKASTSAISSRASTVLSGRGTIRTSFFDMLESADGSLSLPRVWNAEISLNSDYKHNLYMGDVLADFAVDATNKHTNKIGNMTFDMAMSPRTYFDGFNGLDDLRIGFSNEKYDLDARYQRHFTDGESRFNGRANGVLALVSNSVSSGAKYKSGNFAFGAHAFSGTITDENLLEKGPVVSSQFEPAQLGRASGAAMDMQYDNKKLNIGLSFGNMHETDTVLGAFNDGWLSLNGADTLYVDAVAMYKPSEKVNLSMRATFADTNVNNGEGIISEISNIKSNAFALGLDVSGFSFTAAMPLAAVDGKMGYGYADMSVVENDDKFDVAVNNQHTEYIDLATQKRELRFSGSYKKSVGEFTDAGIGFIYRVNPGNTDAFGNESIFMFKLHHRLGI